MSLSYIKLAKGIKRESWIKFYSLNELKTVLPQILLKSATKHKRVRKQRLYTYFHLIVSPAKLTKDFKKPKKKVVANVILDKNEGQKGSIVLNPTSRISFVSIKKRNVKKDFALNRRLRQIFTRICISLYKTDKVKFNAK